MTSGDVEGTVVWEMVQQLLKVRPSHHMTQDPLLPAKSQGETEAPDHYRKVIHTSQKSRNSPSVHQPIKRSKMGLNGVFFNPKRNAEPMHRGTWKHCTERLAAKTTLDALLGRSLREAIPP